MDHGWVVFSGEPRRLRWQLRSPEFSKLYQITRFLHSFVRVLTRIPKVQIVFNKSL
jgi:hypothetical protein